MAYIHPDKLLELRSIELLSYLKRNDPTNLIRISRDVYCTREHDSLKISNGKWYWWSRGIGGASALDYLIKVKGYSFLEAANMLLNESTGEVKANADKKEGESREKELLLPKKNGNSDIVRAYLLERGIDEDIINSCINDAKEMIKAVEDCGFFESIPLWAVTLIGSLFITVLSFIIIMSVYGRFFKLYMYTAIAPIPLSTFAGEPTQQIGKSFLKSYAAVCLEGAIIVLACVIFSVFAASPPAVNADAAPAAMVWSYVGELVFNMLVLVGAVKMADRIVREMMGL